MGLGVVILVGAYLWFAVATRFFTFATVATAAYAVALALAGTLVWLRRRVYLTGPLMVLAAYLTLMTPLQRIPESGALFAIGTHLNGLQEAVLAYVLLTYPSGRAGRGFLGTLARLAVIGAPILAVLDLVTRPNGTSPCFISACSDQPNPFLIVDLGSVVAEVSIVVLGVMAAVVFGAVVWRFVNARGAARRALAPVLIAGAIAAIGVVLRQVSAGDVVVANVARSAQLLIPVALGIGFIRSRMARAGVAELVLRAGREPTAADLEAAIGRTLHDPSVRLLRWSAAGDSYLDANGQPAAPRETDDRQATIISGRAGRLATSIQAQTADAHRLPSGVVTFVYTDVEGSTELLERLRERYAELLSELRQLLRRAIRDAGGTEIDSRADEFFAAVPDASEAVRAALSVQRQLGVHPWPEGTRVRIRIGLHTGEPERTAEGYVGMDVHLAARVGATGNGGQIVLSDATREAVRDRLIEGAIDDLGRFRLKGIPRAVRLYQLSQRGTETSFAPIRAERVSA